jgi:hypothetical protein
MEMRSASSATRPRGLGLRYRAAPACRPRDSVGGPPALVGSPVTRWVICGGRRTWLRELPRRQPRHRVGGVDAVKILPLTQQ